MDADLKKTLKAVTLELRHLLEGRYDQASRWKPGDLEQRLAAIGVRRDRASVPVDELGHLAEEDRQARKVVDAYLKLRDEAGVERSEAVAEFVRETAYTWANRLLALRCMEARELIDSVILQQNAYGGRSLEHHRLAQRHPELCTGDDDGLFAVLDKVFRAQAGRLPMLFDPQAPGIALRPSAAALKDCFGMLSLNPDTLRKYRIRFTEDETASPNANLPNPFTAPDSLGWAYQYWNTEEKNRVFETVRTVKGAKIAGTDIIPATQLYTEDYMVKFLVQNSLGATWMGMYPESRLAENWEYYVKDADRAPVEKKPVREITFLDPACGSGHFHLEAFDLFYAMYQEEGELTAPEEICNAILTKNLFGIDIDARAVQIAEVALWMKAAERAFDYMGAATNLVAATASHLKGEAWEEFLAGFKREPSVARVLRSFARTMEHIDEIGSLARPAEDLREIIQEEHATWERQVREKKEANFLFPEMNEAAVSGQLPFHEISDEEFGDRLFYRAKAGIDTFTERARVAGEFEDHMLGSETRAGFRLVDLLSRSYTIVAANPPYLGDKKFSPEFKLILRRLYPVAWKDLLAAFVERQLELVETAGFSAHVTQHALLTVDKFSRLRTHLIDTATLDIIAPLGAGAFEEISGEVVNVSLCILRRQIAAEAHRVVFLDASAESDTRAKATRIRSSSKVTKTVTQQELRRVPSANLGVFWLPERFIRLLASSEDNIKTRMDVTKGLKTGADRRFVRYFWECPSFERWQIYHKGGGYCRWYGNDHWCVEWPPSRSRVAIRVAETQPASKYTLLIRDERFYLRTDLIFSAMGGRALGVRLGEPGIASDGAQGLVPKDSQPKHLIQAMLNTRPYTAFARALSGGRIAFDKNYILPIPILLPLNTARLEVLGKQCRELKRRIVERRITERCFEGNRCSSSREFRHDMLLEMQTASVLLTLEEILENTHSQEVNLTTKERQELVAVLGPPVGSYPMIQTLDGLPMAKSESPEICNILVEWLATQERLAFDAVKVNELRSRLRDLYVAGWSGLGSNNEIEMSDDVLGEDDEEGDESQLEGRQPIPCETFLEYLSQQLEIHPISVYWILIEAIESAGWRSFNEEEQFWQTRLSTIVLTLLSYRWPKQLENREPVPDWANANGILPLTPLNKESTLSECVQERLTADEVHASGFVEVIGKPLDGWLATDFFKHHAKEFKNRPIAWQLQSGRFTARASPAFVCLMYYHKLNADMLPKLCSQYVGPLRQRQETELRGILAVVPAARSDRQEKRRTELEDAIHELQKFETVLEVIASTGFGPQSLMPTLRQYAIDDAMLALKARWLHRLSELIGRTALKEWLGAAERTGLHANFSMWIADAMAHLDHFCARVDPQAPEQDTFTHNPSAAVLSRLIAEQSASMLSVALQLACGVWWTRFEKLVLEPLKEGLKAVKSEQKACEQELKAEPESDPPKARKLRARIKELKADAKELKDEIDEKIGKAVPIRELIESWQHDELLKWGDWLAGQPLFDRIASLDGRRAAPTTIAEFIAQESLYAPDINDGVRVNISPLQKAGLLAADVLAAKDLDKAIADRAEWRADERRWVREGKLPQPGWWPEPTDPRQVAKGSATLMSEERNRQ